MTETKRSIKARGFWRSYVKIGKIVGIRHHAIFPDRDGEESRIMFCNYCGYSFTINNKCANSNCGTLQVS